MIDMTNNDEIVRAHRQGYAQGAAAGEMLRASMAERIKALETACAEWAEVSQSNYQRAKALEAKLNKAVSALRSIAEQTKDVTPEIVNLTIAIHSVHRAANDILKENE